MRRNYFSFFLKLILLMHICFENQERSHASGANYVQEFDHLSKKIPSSTFRNSNVQNETNKIIFVSYEISLEIQFSQILSEELQGCSLSIAFDSFYEDTLILHYLINLPQPKKIYKIDSSKTALNINKKVEGCQSYFYLLSSTKSTKSFFDGPVKQWNSYGKYIFVALEEAILEVFLKSHFGTKTLYFIGLVPSNELGSWNLFNNEVFSSSPLKKRSRSNKRRQKLFSDETLNLSGRVLKAFTFHWPPNIYIVQNEEGKIENALGVDVNMLMALESVLNSKLSLEIAPAGQLWGYPTSNGSWDGLVGIVSRQEGDIGIAESFIVADGGRNKQILFTSPYDHKETCFLANVPNIVYSWESLLLPFKAEVWIALVIVLLINGITLYLLAYFNCKMQRNDLQPGFDCFLLAFRANIKESTGLRGNLTSNLKVFISFLGLYSIVITVAYSTNLIAFLTVQNYDKPIETIEDLANSDVTTSGLGKFFQSQMETSEDENLHILAQRYNDITSVEAAMNDILNGKTVFIQSKSNLEYYISQTSEKQRQQLRIIKECFNPYNVGIYLQRDSILERSVNSVIGRVYQSGLVRKWFLDSLQEIKKIGNFEEPQLQNASMEAVHENSIRSGMTMDQVRGIFLALVIGDILATFVFFFERVTNYLAK